MHDDSIILKFPKPLEPSTNGATIWQKLRGRARERLGYVAGRLGIPGTIRDLEYTDELTGQRITAKVGVLGTRLTVNGRDYYFSRFTGELVGGGHGCCGS